ncbi:MAG TPA: hypothetical protein VFM34_12745 [Moraxellaceae bacterium]|nr:hypothetical protein [Moraxellaceae bacterium]
MTDTSRRLLVTGALLCLAPVGAVHAENITPDFTVNGYATAAFARLSGNEGATYPKNTNNGMPVIIGQPTTEADTLGGLQFRYRLNDQAAFVMQEVAQSFNDPSQQYTEQNNYSLRTDWLYMDYRFNDDLTLRAGRFAFSTYLYSENMKVGEAYPWVRLPQEIYSQLGGLNNNSGVELLYKHSFGDWNLLLQPNYTSEQLNGFAVNNATQLAATLSNDSLTLHLGTGTSPINIEQPGLVQMLQTAAGAPAGTPFGDQIAASINLQHDRAVFNEAGFLFDDGKWFAAGEATSLRVKGWFPDHNASYLSVGHYVGKWLPYAMYSTYKTTNNYQLAMSLPAPIAAALGPSQKYQQATASLGARYQFKPNMSLKMEADRISDFNNTSGLFNLPPSNPQLKTVYLYSLGMTAAF